MDDERAFVVVSGWLLLLWLVGLILLAEPSPLQTPESMVGVVQSLSKLPEPHARVAPTIVLRGVGIGMIGVFLAGVLRAYPLSSAAPAVLLLTPLLAVGVRW
jgi:hypothetical protein